MSTPAIVIRYLKKFGFTKWTLESSGEKLYNNIVVIPAIHEYENLQALVNCLCKIDSKYFPETLFVFVINNLANSSAETKDDNQKSLRFLRSIINKNFSDPFAKDILNSKMHLGLVDASSEGSEMPSKEGGVGFARKIGMDLALTVFDYDSSRKKIIICLDADCLVQPEYLTTIVEEFNNRNISAGYVEYEHQPGESEQEKMAIITYEIFLRYYVLGLKWANSPYAFDTIGSTMICDAESYIRIGGMNKRKAAEDFYFMEKLSKIVDIIKIRETKIFPSPRKSWRVPFGTGQRINRFFAGTNDEFLLIDPACFQILKQWLEVYLSQHILSAEEYMAEAKKINPGLHQFLTGQLFEESWNKILMDTKRNDQLQKQKIFWFDGFRTMKLIHYLRDSYFSMINMFDALDRLFLYHNIKIERAEPIPGWKKQFEYLGALRKIS